MTKKELLANESLHDNFIVQGDNIKVLNELVKKYAGTVDCIYIDPPYNNGELYNFYSDKISHDDWIKYMKKAISLLKDMLKENGSLWVSIDDGEMHYLKVLCDEVFGRDKFITTIIWQQRNTRENRKIFSNNHEYVLVYSPRGICYRLQMKF